MIPLSPPRAVELGGMPGIEFAAAISLPPISPAWASGHYDSLGADGRAAREGVPANRQSRPARDRRWDKQKGSRKHSKRERRIAANITLGDPVPWFRGRNLSGGPVDLHVSAGRWILLAFLGSLSEPHTQRRLAWLAQQAAQTTDDQLMIYALLAVPPEDAGRLGSLGGPVLRFIADYDGAIAACYGAQGQPRTIALDPMLRAIADISCGNPEEHDQVLERFLRELPSVDNSAGVPLTAPVLMVPRVFDFPLCDLLLSIYEQAGGTDSGFLVDRGGKPGTLVDHHRKSRRDLVITHPELRQKIRERMVTRLLPEIERYFQFRATRMERYLIACYESESGGHFFRHRDNLNAGAEHRRFAVSLNLNGGYEGCDLVFPEFGRRTYRAPTGGAMVFSCGALHEVTPITKGKRYAFLPFLFGEGDAPKSIENNRLLREIRVGYQADEESLLAPSGA